MSESLVPATLRFHEGTPYSEAFGDLYHNANGGIEKKRHVFLGGNDLPARWAGHRACSSAASSSNCGYRA